MLPFLKSREKYGQGLDIGTSSVKLIKLKFLKEGFELTDFNLEPISKPEDLSAAIKKITARLDLKKVNLSVSGPAAVIRYLSFPRMQQEELRQALKFEASKHIPFSVDQVNLDAFILKQDAADNKMLVLLAAVKKELVAQRLKLMEDCLLEANTLDIDSLALVNAFNFNYSGSDGLKGKTVALLNIGAATTNLNIIEDGLPLMSRDINLAGNNFTQKLMGVFGLGYAQAENLKVNPPKEEAEKISQAVEAVATILAGEIRTSFDYYESQSAASVAKIFLSGGMSLFAGLKDMLANLLSIEVQHWNPLKKIALAQNLDAALTGIISGQFAVAVGLAMRP